MDFSFLSFGPFFLLFFSFHSKTRACACVSKNSIFLWAHSAKLECMKKGEKEEKNFIDDAVVIVVIWIHALKWNLNAIRNLTFKQIQFIQLFLPVSSPSSSAHSLFSLSSHNRAQLNPPFVDLITSKSKTNRKRLSSCPAIKNKFDFQFGNIWFDFLWWHCRCAVINL